jgi:glycyl-tRNA synthetase (class II)
LTTKIQKRYRADVLIEDYAEKLNLKAKKKSKKQKLVLEMLSTKKNSKLPIHEYGIFG